MYIEFQDVEVEKLILLV